MNINDLFEMGPIGSNLELSATVLAFPPFERVIKQSKDKDKAIQEIKYILWLNHWSSPYNVISPDIRSKTIKKELFGNDKYELSDIALIAEKAYIEEYQTSEVLEMLSATREAIWYVTSYLKSIRGKDGEDPDKIIKLAKQMGDTYKSLSTLEKAIKLQTDLGSKIKGGNELNPYEVKENNRYKS